MQMAHFLYNEQNKSKTSKFKPFDIDPENPFGVNELRAISNSVVSISLFVFNHVKFVITCIIIFFYFAHF